MAGATVERSLSYIEKCLAVTAVCQKLQECVDRARSAVLALGEKEAELHNLMTEHRRKKSSVAGGGAGCRRRRQLGHDKLGHVAGVVSRLAGRARSTRGGASTCDAVPTCDVAPTCFACWCASLVRPGTTPPGATGGDRQHSPAPARTEAQPPPPNGCNSSL